MNTDRRDNHRVLVGPEHTIRFLVKGHAYRNVRITNLSHGGCFATVLQSDAAHFLRGSLLEQFAFEHPDLPHDAFTAQVAYTLGDSEDEDEDEDEALAFMGLGIQFIAPPRDIELGLERALKRMTAGS